MKSSLPRRCFKVHILVVDVRNVLSVVGRSLVNLRQTPVRFGEGGTRGTSVSRTG